jgi:hypothetical protein
MALARWYSMFMARTGRVLPEIAFSRITPRAAATSARNDSGTVLPMVPDEAPQTKSRMDMNHALIVGRALGTSGAGLDRWATQAPAVAQDDVGREGACVRCRHEDDARPVRAVASREPGCLVVAATAASERGRGTTRLVGGAALLRVGSGRVWSLADRGRAPRAEARRRRLVAGESGPSPGQCPLRTQAVRAGEPRREEPAKPAGVLLNPRR